MRTIPHLDILTGDVIQVPDTAISHVAFCDLARDSWATLREALGLPDCEPVFEWDLRDGANYIGDSLRRGDIFHRLSDQCHAFIRPTDDGKEQLRGLASTLSARRPVPAAFGRPPLPVSVYWSVVLTCVRDDFALRVVHDWFEDESIWATRVDVMYAASAASEVALSFVHPACPRCGSACWWEGGVSHRETPTTPMPVACRCGWKGVCQVVR